MPETATYPCRENKTSIVLDVELRKEIADVRDQHKNGTTMGQLLTAMLKHFKKLGFNEQAALLARSAAKQRQ